jgi:hypothetical protein
MILCFFMLNQFKIGVKNVFQEKSLLFPNSLIFAPLNDSGSKDPDFH